MPGRLTVTVLRVDICGNTLPQFHPGILNLKDSNTLQAVSATVR